MPCQLGDAYNWCRNLTLTHDICVCAELSTSSANRLQGCSPCMRNDGRFWQAVPLLRYIRKAVPIAKTLLKNCFSRSSAPKNQKLYGWTAIFIIWAKKLFKNRMEYADIWLKSTWSHLKILKKCSRAERLTLCENCSRIQG